MKTKITITILALSMSLIVALSNYLVQFPINDYLTLAAFTYPFCFLITDLSNKLQGPKFAKIVVLFGFLVGIIFSFGIDIRIALASLTAFIVSQLLDIKIFSMIKSKNLWQAPLVSSVIASFIDTLLFFGLAFYNTGLNWIQLASGDYAVKVLIATLALIPYLGIIRYLLSRNLIKQTK